MRLAIMQPYIFPYLGYFQLINSVDKFIFYDDVTYIKGGWINRNNILLNGQKYLFTIPLKKISSYKKINEIEVSELPIGWDNKLINTFIQAYSKAPYFNSVFPLIENTLRDCGNLLISDLTKKSILSVLEYLNIEKNIEKSSGIYNNLDLKSQDRILDICKKEKAKVYINPSGGIDLYEKAVFKNNGLELFFINSSVNSYKQFNCNKFVDSLSIIDVLMFNSKIDILKMLKIYELS